VRLKIFTLICLASLATKVHAQAMPTASRAGDLQIGGSFNLASCSCSGLTSNSLKGYGFYSTFDFKLHYGVEAEFHQVNDPDNSEGVYERTYEVGGRYVIRHYRGFIPYVKVMAGRGVFNFPRFEDEASNTADANLGYTLVAGGIGADYNLIPSINLRAEYQIQKWFSFPEDLTPQMFTIGAAYHFH
jgi:opacity protein-like surface antigen